MRDLSRLAAWLVPRRRGAHLAVALLTLLMLPGAATVLEPIDLEDYDLESPELQAQEVVRSQFSSADHFLGYLVTVRDPATATSEPDVGRLQDGNVDRGSLAPADEIVPYPGEGRGLRAPSGGVFNLTLLRELDAKVDAARDHDLARFMLPLYSEVTRQLIDGGYALPDIFRQFMANESWLTRPSLALDGSTLPARTNWTDCDTLTCLRFDDPNLTQAHIDLAANRLASAAGADFLRLVSNDRAFLPDPRSPVIGPIGGVLQEDGTFEGALYGPGRWSATSTWLLFRMDRRGMEDGGWTWAWKDAERLTSVEWEDGLRVGGYLRDGADLQVAGPRDTADACAARVADGGQPCSVEWAWLDLEGELRATDGGLVTLAVGEAINVEVNRELQQSAVLVLVMGVVITLLLWASLRRWSDVWITLGALGLSLLWMQGLIGWVSRMDAVTGWDLIHRSQFSNLLPILILALGIDDSLHALHRYKEERRGGATPLQSAEVTVARVGRAILLTSLTTMAAFSSNLGSEIPALRSFGLEAALGVLAAFVLTGMWVPLVRASVDERQRRRTGDDAVGVGHETVHLVPTHWLSAIAGGAARSRWIVAGLAVLLTVPATLGLLALEGDFKVADFLDEESDFAISVAMINERFVDEGEPASVLIEGDIADPAVFAAIREARRATDSAPEGVDSRIATKPDGTSDAWAIDAVVELAVASLAEDPSVWAPLGWDENASDHGVGCEDGSNGLPNLSTRGCLVALYGLAWQHGVPAPLGNAVFPAEAIRTYVTTADELDPARPWLTVDGEEPSWTLARIRFGLRQPEDFAGLAPALEELHRDLAPLHALTDGSPRSRGSLDTALDGSGPKLAWVVPTDEPVTRYVAASGMQDQLQSSLILGAVFCLLVLWWGFGSLREAVITLGPILLVVVWLYGLIEATGNSLNIVTVAIAAMSLGVGIDYCIHVTERFREERSKGGTTAMSLAAVGSASGVALVGSAASDALGFLVISQARMGLFQLFGLFSAIMIGLSLVASLILTPAALAIAHPSNGAVPESTDEDA